MLSTATLGAPTPGVGASRGAGRGVHRNAPWGSTGTGVNDGLRSPCCAQRGVRGTRGGPPGSHLAWPHPAPRQCFWAAAPGGTSPAWPGSAPSCQAEAAAEPAPPNPPGAPPSTPPTQGLPQGGGGCRAGGIPGAPLKTHSLPLQLGQRLLLGLPVGPHALQGAGLEQRDTPAGTVGG